MAKLRLPTVLRPLAGGVPTVEVPAGSLGSLRDAIRTAYPSLAERVYDGEGRVREFINVFVDGEDVRDLGDEHAVAERSEVVLLPAISGGA
ncbi:MAG: MoaD/ThiS family protein [Candidatus Limnocylindria bacterium]